MPAYFFLFLLIGFLFAFYEFCNKYSVQMAEGNRYGIVSYLILFLFFTLQYRKWQSIDFLYKIRIKGVVYDSTKLLIACATLIFFYYLVDQLYHPLPRVYRSEGMIPSIIFIAFKLIVVITITAKFLSVILIFFHCGILGIGFTIMVIFHNTANGTDFNLLAYYETIVNVVFESLSSRATLSIAIVLVVIQFGSNYLIRFIENRYG